VIQDEVEIHKKY